MVPAPRLRDIRERLRRPPRRDLARRLRLRDVRVQTLVEALRRFLDHRLIDWGAALTFYAGISLIPALVIVIGALGLVGDSVLDGLAENLQGRSPGPVRSLVLDGIEQVSANRLGAGIALLIGIVGALWSASSYVGGFLRASGVIHEQTVRYPFWRLRPLQLALTLATMVAISGTAIAVVITGPLAKAVAGLVGAESVVATVWDLAKWPLVIAFVLAIFGVLYWASPDVRNRGFQLITPGGVIATAGWVLGSIAYAVYVEAFADYADLYGSLGAVIGFLIWLWGSNMAMLYGVELNSCLERDDAAPPGGEPLETAA
jgi:membrane protein